MPPPGDSAGISRVTGAEGCNRSPKTVCSKAKIISSDRDGINHNRKDYHMRTKEDHNGCMEKVASHLYRIGMFAQMNHVTVKTLRFYEEQGLLMPAHVDEESGYRYYTMDQMSVVHRITALKQAGFTLEDIGKLQAGADEKALLMKKKASILEKIAELTAQMAIIDGYLSDDVTTLSRPVLVKTLPAVTVAASRARLESYDMLFSLMPEMGAEMERLGVECALPEYCFTQYLEPGYQEENILIETCEAVTGKRAGTEKLAFYDLPETQAACIYHKGSYDNFAKTYAVILKYIEDNGYEICGNIRESYIDGVWNRESEADWLSEIQIPVRKLPGGN